MKSGGWELTLVIWPHYTVTELACYNYVQLNRSPEMLEETLSDTDADTMLSKKRKWLSQNENNNIIIMLINRLKFEDKNDVKCFQDDPQLPIYAALPFGYPVHELIDILMKSDMPLQKICTVQPLGVTENAVFVISIDDVIFDDLKADDLGSWKGTGTKRIFFRLLSSGGVRFSARKPNSASKYYILTRRYFVHNTYNKFHRLIADIRGKIKRPQSIIIMS